MRENGRGRTNLTLEDNDLGRDGADRELESRDTRCLTDGGGSGGGDGYGVVLGWNRGDECRLLGYEEEADDEESATVEWHGDHRVEKRGRGKWREGEGVGGSTFLSAFVSLF